MATIKNPVTGEYDRSNRGQKDDVQPIRKNEDIKKVLACLADKDLMHNYGKRNFMIFMVGINTALRCGDILKLTVKQARSGGVWIAEQKTGKRRWVGFENIQGLMNSYIQGMSDDEYLFQSRKGKNKPLTRGGYYKVIAKVERALNRHDLGTHTMRKTYGYHFYKDKKDIGTLMMILNHSNEATTKRYIGITDDEVQAAMRGFSLGLPD